MEDYHSAFLERAYDTETLHNNTRRLGAMHMGGIALECLLKSVVVEYHRIQEWKTEYNDQRHTIYNPGHDLIEAIKKIPRLLHRVQSNPALMSMVNKVQQPNGDFISIRYKASDPDHNSYMDWYNSYKRLLQWLLKQRTEI